MVDPDINTQLALVVQSVQAQTAVINANHSAVLQILNDHEARLRKLADDQAATDIAVAQIRERQGTLTIIQTAWTALASAVAAAIGKVT